MNIIRIANSASGSPVGAASEGEIWDIDGNFGGRSLRHTTLCLLDLNGDYTLLAKQLSSDGGTQGIQLLELEFDGLTDGIDAIVVYQAGKPAISDAPTGGWTSGNGVGLTGTGFWNDDVGSYTQLASGNTTHD